MLKVKGVDYEALDGQPTYLFFMIAAPEGANDTSPSACGPFSITYRSRICWQIERSGNSRSCTSTFPSSGRSKEAEEKAEQEQTTPAPESNRKYIIAVTACPTGIAHTYMAEDALKKKQKKWA